jgi:DNA-binding NarL/FixJ family response regulator
MPETFFPIVFRFPSSPFPQLATMPLTILVVDDDPGIRVSISDYLEMAGYSVIPAQNGQDALQKVEQYQPHLIVTDVLMPQMDGYELVRQVRQRPAFRLIPVIFLTARNQTQERVRGYQLGGDLYMPKPFELEELGAVVRNFLDRYVLLMTQAAQLNVPPIDRGPPSHTPDSWDHLHHVSATAVAELHLTGREQDVLKLLAQGLSNPLIGKHLNLSPRTIEKHVSSLLQKTETTNRSELVRFAIEHHLVD